MEISLFAFFGIIACVTAVMVITRRNPIISALFLVLNFAALAGLYLLLYAQFIAVVQIIVYAGAIMVLFLFVIMLLKPEADKNFFEENPKIKIASLVIGLIVFVQIAITIWNGMTKNPVMQGVNKAMEIGTVEAIGKELYTNYLLPFEAIGFVLLASTIGALILAKKKLD
ncbi:MAG: NADH-quinone oxidoreductase subunit J [Ignavibacteriales bacterium]|nr:NADH-quinone oxidoreductase subunit J [Ignavibacteriales bacterium]